MAALNIRARFYELVGRPDLHQRFPQTLYSEVVKAELPGQHTEEVLLEIGLNWEEIGQLGDNGAI